MIKSRKDEWEGLSPDIRADFQDSTPVEDALKALDWEQEASLDVDDILDYTKARIVEDILQALDEEHISKAELAERLGKSRQYVSRILSESANFTVDSIVRIACALKREPCIRLAPPNTRLRFEERHGHSRVVELKNSTQHNEDEELAVEELLHKTGE